MPHYSDGSEAHTGDIVKAPHGDALVIGVVTSIITGTDTCNCTLYTVLRKGSGFVVPVAPVDGWYTLSDLTRVA